MPTYEYHCEKCKKSFEVFQSMKAEPLTVCPKEQCRQKTWGKGRVKRQLGTGAGLIFKGSGFYITDYRSEGYKDAAKKDAPTAPSASAGGGEKSGSEAKPAAEPKKPAAAAKSKPASKARD